MQKILLVTDFPTQNWIGTKLFVKNYPRTDIKICSANITQPSQQRLLQKFSIWLPNILLVLKSFVKGEKADLIVCWQQITGIFLCLIFSFFKITKPKIFIVGLIYNPSQGFLGKIKHAVFNEALKRVNLISCATKAELVLYQKTFNLPSEKLCFVRFGFINQEMEDLYKQQLFRRNKPYILACGKSNRDFATFIAATHNLDYKIKIAALKTDLSELEIPKNTETIHNAWGKDYDILIANAEIVVIPLKKSTISAGQIDAIKAIFYQRPLIISETAGIKDYLTKKDALFYQAENPKDLQEKIKLLLSNKLLRQQLAQSGYQKTVQEFSQENFVLRIIEQINNHRLLKNAE